MSAEKKSIADETRARILDQSAKLFKERGFAAVSLRAIADAADMKAGSVYYHFKSKEDIVLEVLDTGIEKVHRAVEDTFRNSKSSDTPAEIVKACIATHLETLHTHSDYTSANVRIYGQVPEEIREKALRVRRRYEKLWDSILESCYSLGGFGSNVDLKLFRLMLIGTLNATLEWFDPEKGDIQELAANYSYILLNGLMDK